MITTTTEQIVNTDNYPEASVTLACYFHMSALMLPSLSTELQPAYVECGILTLAGQLTLNIDMLTRVIIFYLNYLFFFLLLSFFISSGRCGFLRRHVGSGVKKNAD